MEWIGDKQRCPRCTAEGYPHVILLALIHLLVPDEKGAIPSSGRRYRLGCDKPREYLATMTNQEGATGDVRQVNCTECLNTAKRLGIGGVVIGSVLHGQPGAVLS